MPQMIPQKNILGSLVYQYICYNNIEILTYLTYFHVVLCKHMFVKHILSFYLLQVSEPSGDCKTGWCDDVLLSVLLVLLSGK